MSSKRALIAAGIALVPTLLVVGGAVAAFHTVDIRPAYVIEHGDEAAAQTAGRARLQAVAAAHGLEAWRAHETLEIVATDDWSPTFVGRASCWWRTDQQRLRHRMIGGTFTSDIELLDGPEQGERLAIQAWHTYHADSDGELTETSGDQRTTFYLPTLQYFAELPFRLLESEIIADGGTGEFEGQTYDRIFVTWGSLEPNDEMDQYDLWIDRTTNRIHSVRYTIREALPSFAGTIFFEDYREVEDVLIAFRQTVVLDGHEDVTSERAHTFLHRYEIESAAFDAFAASELMVDPSRVSADAKP